MKYVVYLLVCLPLLAASCNKAGNNTQASGMDVGILQDLCDKKLHEVFNNPPAEYQCSFTSDSGAKVDFDTPSGALETYHLTYVLPDGKKFTITSGGKVTLDNFTLPTASSSPEQPEAK